MEGWSHGSNLESLYHHNRTLLLEILRSFGPLTIGEISKRMGLSPASVGSMLRELQECGLVEQAGVARSWGGRPPQLYQLKRDKRFAFTVDLCGPAISVGIVDMNRELTRKRVIPHTALGDGVYTIVKEALDDLYNSVDPADLLGIGVAVPGLIEKETGRVILSVPLRLVDFPIGAKLGEAFQRPVFVGRGTDAAILAEYRHNVRGLPENLLLVNIGVGVGVGIIINGQVYAGSHHTAGEWGHTIVVPDGPMCWCGNRGCLEEVASLRALVRYVQEGGGFVVERGGAAGAGAAGPHGDPPPRDVQVGAEWVLKQAAMGDRLCLEAVERLAEFLGRGLFNLVQLFDPRGIIIDVSVEEGAEVLCEAIRRQLFHYRFLGQDGDLDIRLTSLGSQANLIGAGLWVLDQAVPFLRTRPHHTKNAVPRTGGA